MKKRFTLILASMLFTMGAWAEVLLPTVSDGTAMHYYRIKSLRTGKYAAYTGDNTQLAQMADPTIECIWYVTADGENYKLHNLATENVYAGVSSFTSTGVTVYIKENPYRAGYVCISTTENLSSNCWDDQGSGTKIGNYNPRQNDNEGTSWTFEEVSVTVAGTYTFTLTEEMSGQEFTGEYICYTYEEQKNIPSCVTEMGGELVDPVWNEENKSLTATITFPFAVSSANVTNATMITNGASWTSNAKKKWRAVDVDGTNYVKAMTADSELASISNWLWAIYPQLNNGKFTFTIKNLATNTYVCANPESAADVQGTNKPVSLAAEGTAFTYEQRDGQYCNFAYVNNEGTRLVLSINGSGDTNVFLGVYGGSHKGNDIGFPSVIETTVFPFPISEEGEENWTFMTSSEMSTGTGYFYVNNDGKIVSMSTINANGLSYLPTVETLTKWQWAIYPTFENGCFTFKIKNAATDKYVPKTANGNGEIFITTEAESANFSWATCVGNAYGFLLENTTNVFLSVNSSAKDEQKCILWTKPASTSHVGANIKFLDSRYTVTIGSTGYSTLYTPIKVAVPEDVTAYTGELNGEWLTLTEIENVIPANIAVVLQGDANTYTFNASSAEATEIENNDLTGSTETVATSSVEGTVYTLQSHNGGVAFKRYTGTNLTGFKAYLAVESQAQAIRIRKGSEEGTTSIENAQLTMDNENVVIYDLQGRRVEKMEKGIYIVNGKKIIK